jgi:2',3'-cyclic-nucleotide 2'-phosphodiesterase (5'-nucleotidase family)
LAKAFFADIHSTVKSARESGEEPQALVFRHGFNVSFEEAAIRAAPPGARVKTVMVNGAAVDPGRDYKLATNDFVARGADGYGMLAGKTQVSADSGTRLVALDVIDYVEALKLIDAKVEGRIVFR